MRTSALLDAKNLNNLKIYGMSARTGGEKGLSQCGQGGWGSIFRGFVRTSFMDGR